jgi:hypothetical protein
LKDEQVDLIYNNYGNKSLAYFSVRLFSRYFSPNERIDKQTTRARKIESLDQVRIGFIKSHLQERNGGPLSDKQWKQCKNQMIQRQWDCINYSKKRKNKIKND